MNTQYAKDLALLKRGGEYYAHKPLEGYTDEVEALLQAGKYSETEEFTFDFSPQKPGIAKRLLPISRQLLPVSLVLFLPCSSGSMPRLLQTRILLNDGISLAYRTFSP